MQREFLCSKQPRPKQIVCSRQPRPMRRMVFCSRQPQMRPKQKVCSRQPRPMRRMVFCSRQPQMRQKQRVCSRQPQMRPMHREFFCSRHPQLTQTPFDIQPLELLLPLTSHLASSNCSPWPAIWLWISQYRSSNRNTLKIEHLSKQIIFRITAEKKKTKPCL